MKKMTYGIGFMIMCLTLAGQPVRAAECSLLSRGQTLYVPAYSHIYIGDKQRPYLLTITLSVRNIDPDQAITISSVGYYETGGKLVKQYLESPLILGPLGSGRFIVPRRDKEGGSGANFMVTWNAASPVNPPIVESIMIGTQSQQGISFTSRGVVIQAKSK